MQDAQADSCDLNRRSLRSSGNPLELIELIMAICQDPRHASSTAVKRQLECIKMRTARTQHVATSEKPRCDPELEAVYENLGRLRENERRHEHVYAELKQANLALTKEKQAITIHAHTYEMKATALALQLEAAQREVAEANCAKRQHAEQVKAELLAHVNELEEVERARETALRSELATAKQESDEWRRQAETVKEEIVAMGVADRDKHEALKSVQAELLILSEEYKNLSQQIALEKKEVEAAQQECVVLREADKESRRAMKMREDTLRMELATASDEINRLKDLYKSTIDSVQRGDMSITALQKKLEEANGEVEALRAATEEQRRELMSLRRECARTKIELNNAQADASTRMTALAQDLTDAKEDANRCRSLLSATSEEVSKGQSLLEISMEETQTVRESCKDEILLLEEEVKRWKEAAERAQGEVTEKSSVLSSLHEEHYRVLAESQDSRDKASQWQKTAEAAKDRIQLLDAEMLRKESVLADTEMRIEKLAAEVRNAHDEAARFEAAAELVKGESASRFFQLQNSLEEMRAREVTLTDELATKMEELRECQAIVEARGKEMAMQRYQATEKESETRSALDATEARVVVLEGEKKRYEKELEHWRFSAETAERKYESLLEENQNIQSSFERRIQDEFSRANILETELIATKKDLVNLKSVLESSDGQKREKEIFLEKSLAEARSIGKDLQVQLVEAEQKVLHWRESTQAAHSESNEVRSALDEARTQIATLEKDLELAQHTTIMVKSAAQPALMKAGSTDSPGQAPLYREPGVDSESSAMDLGVAPIDSEKNELGQFERKRRLYEEQEREPAFADEITVPKDKWLRLKADLDFLRDENAALQSKLKAVEGKGEAKLSEGKLLGKLQRMEWSSSSWKPPTTFPGGDPTEFFFVEIGTWRIRAGWVEVGTSKSFQTVEFPCIIARPSKASADLTTIVQHASIKADAMYGRFREMGVFIGKDAWYCAFDHPDPVLRGSLKLEAPFDRDRLIRPADLKLLLKYVFEKCEVCLTKTPLVVTYKPTSTLKEREEVVEMLFEYCEASSVRFLNEATMLSSLANVVTALTIDLGEDTTRVVPIYEQMILEKGVETAALGGIDLTKYMAYMLLSRRNEVYSSLVERKMLEVARLIKESHAYVAADFNCERGRYGTFEREKIDVMKFHRAQIATEESVVPGRRLDMASVREPDGKSNTSRDGRGSVEVRQPLKNGEELVLSVGCERFHCGELFFRPKLFPDIGQTTSVIDLVMKSLASVDKELWPLLLSHVLIAGQSSRLPGLVERITKELKDSLPPEFAGILNINHLEVALTGGNMEEERRIEGGETKQYMNEEKTHIPDSDEIVQNTTAVQNMTAVSRGALARAAEIISERGSWISAEVYNIDGPQAIEDPAYICTP